MFLKYSDCNEKQKMQVLYVLSMKDNNDIILKTANNSSVYCHMETKTFLGSVDQVFVSLSIFDRTIFKITSSVLISVNNKVGHA
jgi:hypothetical protein